VHSFVCGLWSRCSMCGKLWVTVPLLTFAYVFGAGFVQSQLV